LSVRDPDCRARENETPAVLRPEAQIRARGMPSDYSGGEKLLTKGEVAQLCRVEVRTVDRWLTAGKITCYRTPSGRMLFRRNDVLIAIERKPAPGHSADKGAHRTPRPA
jgi:excisionase family DNA binding protein